MFNWCSRSLIVSVYGLNSMMPRFSFVAINNSAVNSRCMFTTISVVAYRANAGSRYDTGSVVCTWWKADCCNGQSEQCISHAYTVRHIQLADVMLS